jgi:flagellar biosynthesis anti-sigma factor FlgM
MDSTRRLGRGITRAEVSRRATTPTQATGNATSRPSDADAVSIAESMPLLGGLVETAQAEIAAVDSRVIGELKDAIANGSFEVDSDALADRIIEDALGEGAL